MDFIRNVNPLEICIIAIIIGFFLRALLYQHRVKTTGTEATATVTWKELKDSSDGQGGRNYYYEIHIAYHDKDGRYIEGSLSNPSDSLEEGDLIRIKYVDDKPETPVYIGRV